MYIIMSTIFYFYLSLTVCVCVCVSRLQSSQIFRTTPNGGSEECVGLVLNFSLPLRFFFLLVEIYQQRRMATVRFQSRLQAGVGRLAGRVSYGVFFFTLR